MEAQLLLWLHGHGNAALDALFVLTHVLGSLPFCVALVLAAAAWHGRRREGRHTRLWVAVGIGVWVLQKGLKLWWGRPRPELWPRLVEQDGFSFPSGHALASAAFYPLLAWVLAQRYPRRAGPLYALGFGLPLAIGIGRLYLGLHWPSDVLAGWVLGGLLSTAAVARLTRGDGPASPVDPADGP